MEEADDGAEEAFVHLSAPRAKVFRLGRFGRFQFAEIELDIC